jgi:hypothetical protein
VEANPAGSGAWGAAPAVSGGGRSREQRGKRRARGRRSRQESEGPVRDFQRIQGPFCKLKFPIDTEVK